METLHALDTADRPAASANVTRMWNSVCCPGISFAVEPDLVSDVQGAYLCVAHPLQQLLLPLLQLLSWLQNLWLSRLLPSDAGSSCTHVAC